MKHFLLSWYGITDLNASLGVEELGGPVLAALRTGEFTDALILAYTDPSKDTAALDDARRTSLEAVASLRAQQAVIPRTTALACTDAFANSSAGHAHYETWLRSKLEDLGSSARISIMPRTLSHLNDSKAIYDAAVEALATVMKSDPGSKITFYISPGTPVMAFTWAFVAALNPDQHIAVLACPDFRKPPEPIALPYDLFTKPTRPAQVPIDHGDGSFDAVFHLFGEQRLPSVFAIRQFRCHKHIFLTTSTYPSAVMKSTMANPGQWEEILVDAFDPLTVRAAILKRAADLPAGARLGFNLTGGTKLMFAGAIAACRRVGGVPFYFETHGNSMMFLDDYSHVPMAGISRVDDFVKIMGYKINEPGRWPDQPQRESRRALTKALWEHRRDIAKLYGALSEYNDDRRGYVNQFVEKKGKVSAELFSNGDAEVSLGQKKFEIPGCYDLARYLCGGWLEEFVYMLLEESLKAGRIQDLRIGMELLWGDAKTTHLEDTAQEFDVTLTDGKRLTIIECKAGGVWNEDLYRLANSMRHYGGIQANGVLVAAFRPPAAVLKRVKAMMPNLRVLSDDQVPARLLEAALD
jgi:hypothetical protein